MVADRLESSVGASCEHPFEKPPKLAAPDRVLQLPHSLCLDLSHSFASHFEDPTNFFQRVRVTVTEPIPELDNFTFPICQRLEDIVNLVLEHLLRGRVDGTVGIVVFDEITEVAVLALANWAVQANGMT